MRVPKQFLAALAKKPKQTGSHELLRWNMEKHVIAFGRARTAARRRAIAVSMGAKAVALYGRAGVE